MSSFAGTLLAMLCILNTGCGSSEYDLVPVSGVITLDGKPIVQAVISLQPIGGVDNPNPGPSSRGQADDAGHFELATIQGEPGAVVGKHRVVISSPRPPQSSSNDSGLAQPAFKDPIPARYNENSELTFEVPPEGTSAADFKLTTSP